MRYLDLVVVKLNNGQDYLFRAPAWSRLNKDDEVYVDVDTVSGSAYGKVVGSITTETTLDSEEATLLINMTHATLPIKKVLERVVSVKLDYKDDPYEEENYEQTEQTEEQEA